MPEPIHDLFLEVFIEVEIDPTATFLVYDDSSKSFTIDESSTTNYDTGVYYTWITLVDSYDNRS